MIGWALDHRFAMVVLAVASFVGALALPMLGLVGGGFFPDSDDSEFLINIETPPGSNLEYTKVKAEEAARLARDLPEVRYTYTTIGGRTGSVDEAHRLREAGAEVPSARGTSRASRRGCARSWCSSAASRPAIGSGNFENQKQIQLAAAAARQPAS